MSDFKFFRKNKPSNILNERGPSYEDQLFAMANDKYWTVLNSSLLSSVHTDKQFCRRINAFKHALQTYGPNTKDLPDLRQNQGKARGHVFHGHINDSNGKTYELEWAVVDSKKRILALTHFDIHENFDFEDKPLGAEEIKRILSHPENIKIMERVGKKIEEAKKKVARVENNYKVEIR